MIDFGEGVFLSTLSECDPDELQEWRNDPKIWAWTRQNDLITSEAHRAWWERIQTDPTIKMYTIFRPDSHKDGEALVGVCGLTSINLQNRNAEFSLYIAPEFQGQGLSKPSLITLFAHGFMNMGLKSIWGETFEGNRAAKIFEDIGMVKDGTRRKFYWKAGNFIDAHLYSILDLEFIIRHGRRSCF